MNNTGPLVNRFFSVNALLQYYMIQGRLNWWMRNHCFEGQIIMLYRFSVVQGLASLIPALFWLVSHLISHSLASPVRIFTAQKVSQFASLPEPPTLVFHLTDEHWLEKPCDLCGLQAGSLTVPSRPRSAGRVMPLRSTFCHLKGGVGVLRDAPGSLRRTLLKGCGKQ